MALHLLSSSFASTTPSFETYVAAHAKQYATTSELNFRRSLYAASLAEIVAHEAGPFRAGFTRGVNKFSDWTPAEKAARFGLDKAALMGGRAARLAARGGVPAPAPPAPVGGFPSSWDWHKKGALTKPRDQGTCGSCWAFAAAEAIESQLFLSSYGKLAVLSPQAMVDCVPNPRQCGGTGGCEGNTFNAHYFFNILYD